MRVCRGHDSGHRMCSRLSLLAEGVLVAGHAALWGTVQAFPLLPVTDPTPRFYKVGLITVICSRRGFREVQGSGDGHTAGPC